MAIEAGKKYMDKCFPEWGAIKCTRVTSDRAFFENRDGMVLVYREYDYHYLTVLPRVEDFFMI